MNDYGLKSVATADTPSLRSVDVSARISGLLAETTLTQKYQNDTKTNLELTYTFPLPVGAILLSFLVQVGERRFNGEVVPRADAEVAYEKALAEGNSAFRLQEIQVGLYNATLGNVMAGEAVEITVTYAETLAWNGQTLRYRLPTTIAPRYGEPTRMQPWQRPVTNMMVEYPLTLTVTIAGELTRCAVNCSSHRVGFMHEGDTLKLTLAKGATMDRDFVLEMENPELQSLGVSAYARDTHVAVLTLLPPPIESHELSRDVVLVLDCSDSMQGDSLNLAKEGIQLALGSMQPNERFGIVAFGSHAVQFNQQLQPPNRKNLDIARHWVNTLRTMGGTNLSEALALALKLHDGAPMDILLLTDGEVWLPGDTLSVAREKHIRVFTLGIGSAVAEDVVEMLATETGGACELVSPTEDMSARIYRHFSRMRQPQMEGLDIRWPSEPQWVSQPERACFAGDAYTVFAAFEDQPEGTVGVSFAIAGQPASAIEIPLAPEIPSADAIVRVAAQRHLADLPSVARKDWALRYQLLTDQTDYLITMVRAEGERAGDFPDLQTQPHMLAAGWGGVSTVDPFAVRMSDLSVRYSRPRSSAFDQLVSDVPAVFCRKSPRASDESLRVDNGYIAFMKNINTAAKGTIFGRLPTTRAELLVALALPAPLDRLLDKFAAAKYSEEDIVRAFYQALIEHEGGVDLNSKTLKKIHSIIGDVLPNTDLVSQILVLLNTLWEKRWQSSGPVRYDIPAFLREQAD